MYRDRFMEISRLRRVVEEIRPYELRWKMFLSDWLYDGRLISPPFKWEGDFAVFEKEVMIDEPYRLAAWFGGESLLKVDDKPYFRINEHVKEVDLSKFADRRRHKITVEVVSRSLFGVRSDGNFSYSYLILRNELVHKVLRYLDTVLELMNYTDDESLFESLVNILDRFLSSVWPPRDTATYLEAMFETDEFRKEARKIWEGYDFTGFRGGNLNERSLEEAFDAMRGEVRRLAEVFPKKGTIHLVGQSHIDYAWLWPEDETKRKLIRTFSSMISLAEKYENFVYAQSSSRMYEDVKVTNKWLYERILREVKRGSWEPVGGMYLEADMVLPGVESMIRQFQFGQKFFEREFGFKADFTWLPDVFGMSWTLPQILKGVGIDTVITTKLNWNESNRFPHDLCLWKGVDGSEVIYYSFNNPKGGYNGEIDANALSETWEGYRSKSFLGEMMATFGYGDGGGGPTEEMVEKIEVLNELPAVPNLKLGSMKEFVDKLRTLRDLPVWEEPLYLELHRGTYTSQERVKRFHKLGERNLRNLEILATLSASKVDTEEMWKVLLKNEFHDILPGSSIRSVYEKVEKELWEIVEKSERKISEILEEASDEDEKWLSFFNPSSFSAPLRFVLSEPLILRLDGKEFYPQRTYDGKYAYSVDAAVKPLSSAKLEVVGRSDALSGKISKNLDYEDSVLRFRVNEDGTFNIEYKSLERNVFSQPAHLAIYKDIPGRWDAWDVDVNYGVSKRVLRAREIEVLENNALRKVYKLIYEFEGSVIEQKLILWRNVGVTEIDNEVDWHTRRTLLRAIFPTTVLSRVARFDIDGGILERFTHKNTNYERARFEVPAHRWMDLSQYDFGVAIINDSKYGHSVNGSELGLSLLRGPVFPDPFADEGFHRFKYWIFPHTGNDILQVVRMADYLNNPLLTVMGNLKLPSFRMSPEVFKILTMRRERNSVILRVVESVGSSGKFEVELGGKHPIRKLNLLNEPAESIDSSIEYHPFEIITLELSE